MSNEPSKADLQFYRNTADSIIARSLPGGAEQDIATDLITAVFAADLDTVETSPLLTLTSASALEIDKLSATSQASVPVTSFTSDPAGDIIEAATATMVDAEVLEGEEVVISGDEAGTYRTLQVLSNTKVRVVETTIDTNAAPTSTITINRGDGFFRVVIDVADMDALDSVDNGVIVFFRTPGGGERQPIGRLCFEFVT